MRQVTYIVNTASPLPLGSYPMISVAVLVTYSESITKPICISGRAVKEGI